MDTLALDPSMGASGDMFLGTLLDLGAPLERLEVIADAIDVSFDLEMTDRAGIAATSVAVSTPSAADQRTPAEVREIVRGIGLAGPVTETALAVVDRLAAAEAAVHGADEDPVHFHAVGADDAIADVCGTVALVDALDPEAIVTTSVATGSGRVATDHGSYPVPVPAVTELAADASWAIRPGPVEGELLTPTGAALLAELADGTGQRPPMRVHATGYGAGDRRYGDHPNVLRAIRGPSQARLGREEIVVLETVLDDATPETLGALQETLPPVGALDVTTLPTTMKEARPGHLLQVVVEPADAAAVARRIARETGTLGVREVPMTHRWMARRRVETVPITVDDATDEVAVKVATDEAGAVIDVSAEDEDVRRVARERDRPVRTIRRLAERAYRDG